MLYIVASNPNWVLLWNAAINLIGQPIVIGIDNRIIACFLDSIAEGINDLGQLLLGKLALSWIVFHIIGNWVGNWIIFYQIEHKVCLCLCISHCHCL